MRAITRALLLASGSGTRLRGVVGLVKLLAYVGRMRLICYPLASLAVAGVSEAFLVTPRHRLDTILAAARDCPLRPPEIVGVESWRWWRGSGYTLLDGLEQVGAYPIIVSVSDHIYHPGIAERSASGCARPFCVAGDAEASLVDIGEATRILAVGDRVVAIGKGLSNYTHIDVGVHTLNAPPRTGSGAASTMSLNDLKMASAEAGLLGLVDVTGYPWIDVDTPEDLERARRGPARGLVEMLDRIARG
ncbi:MAG: NTP transferase domain-containing protein [Desulfurococcales archaeon]|nr:NTP transferase domain-containing protein [Desulfurococcales archaeon]